VIDRTHAGEPDLLFLLDGGLDRAEHAVAKQSQAGRFACFCCNLSAGLRRRYKSDFGSAYCFGQHALLAREPGVVADRRLVGEGDPGNKHQGKDKDPVHVGFSRLEYALCKVAVACRLPPAQLRLRLKQGLGGSQVLVEDPSGSPIELFEALAEEKR
jgi:hypothetical protein